MSKKSNTNSFIFPKKHKTQESINILKLIPLVFALSISFSLIVKV